MTRGDDTEEIRRLLNQNLERVLDALYPGWVKVGRKALLTPKKKADRLSSSFQVFLDGEQRGEWNRYSQSIGGREMNLVAYALTDTHKGTEAYAQVYAWARQFFGLSQVQHETDAQRQERQARREAAARKAEAERLEQERKVAARRERRAATASTIAGECRPISGNLAEVYLTKWRRFPALSRWPDLQEHSIGFHPALEYEPFRKYENGRVAEHGPLLPAIVFFARDPFGDVVQVQQVFLGPDGNKITATDPRFPDAKVALGPLSGGAIRIGGDGPRIGAIEGPESAIGIWALHQFRFPVWSMVSTSGLIGFQPPPFVQRVDLFPDGDPGVIDPRKEDAMSPPGWLAGMKSAARFRGMGLHSVVNDMPVLGDGADLWGTYNECEG